MSLVSGPGKGGASAGDVPDELKLVIDHHVKYIQSLDTVRNRNALSAVCAEAYLLTAQR